MRKLILVVFFLFIISTPYKKAQAMDPKGKAFLIICTYGTVGGALLGFASMAFGTNSRAIAQGASLGLYAGIGFGAYVISSHNNQSNQMMDPAYQDQGAPPPGYGMPDDGYGAPPPPAGGAFGQPMDDGGYGAPAPSDSGGFFGAPQRAFEINDELMSNYKLKNRKGRDLSLPIYVPLFHTVF